MKYQGVNKIFVARMPSFGGFTTPKSAEDICEKLTIYVGKWCLEDIVKHTMHWVILGYGPQQIKLMRNSWTVREIEFVINKDSEWATTTNRQLIALCCWNGCVRKEITQSGAPSEISMLVEHLGCHDSTYQNCTQISHIIA